MCGCNHSVKKPKVTNAGASAQQAANDNGRKTAPKDSKPHTKNVDGVDYKLCNTCKKWNEGEKAHLMEEHIKGKGKMMGPKAAGALSITDNNDTGATL